tara:strand:+ start:5438 stop:5632 length:195 start_codon:yes stop_codon:yes gene_type:complete
MTAPLQETALQVVDIHYGFALVKDVSNPFVIHVMTLDKAVRQLQQNAALEAQQQVPGMITTFKV